MRTLSFGNDNPPPPHIQPFDHAPGPTSHLMHPSGNNSSGGSQTVGSLNLTPTTCLLVTLLSHLVCLIALGNTAAPKVQHHNPHTPANSSPVNGLLLQLPPGTRLLYKFPQNYMCWSALPLSVATTVAFVTAFPPPPSVQSQTVCGSKPAPTPTFSF